MLGIALERTCASLTACCGRLSCLPWEAVRERPRARPPRARAPRAPGAARGAPGRIETDGKVAVMGPDPRARQVLFKMLNSGFLGEINGCVSTGKEANVYHATGAGGADLAVKVYKTSILAFKDRDRRARPRRAGLRGRGARGRRGCAAQPGGVGCFGYAVVARPVTWSVWGRVLAEPGTAACAARMSHSETGSPWVCMGTAAMAGMSFKAAGLHLKTALSVPACRRGRLYLQNRAPACRGTKIRPRGLWAKQQDARLNKGA